MAAVASAWGSRKWALGVKMHRVDLQKCDPHRVQELYFQTKRVKNIASPGKGSKKGELENVMRMLWALVG